MAQRPPQQSPSCEHVSPLFRHTQRPPAQSIAPQHSALDEHALPAPVQHRRVPRSSAHRSPAQHSLSAVHAAVSRGAWHVVVVARHVPAEHVSPGQQSLPAQVWPDVRHTHQVPAAVPERAQVICPQHPPLPTPPSTPASAPAGTVHALPGGAQHRRVAPLVPHTEPVQQSVLLVHPVVPSGRHAATTAHRPPVQRVPSQQSVSSTQMSPAAWHWHRCVVALHSIRPQQSRSRSQLAAWRWQHRSTVGVGRQSKPPQQLAADVHVAPGSEHIAHEPALHPSGVWHAPPAQHARPSEPHVAPGRHWLPWHTSGDAHALPGQHTSPMVPQCSGRWQVPVTHSVPRSHARPLQHA